MKEFEVKISGYEIQQKKAKLTSKKSTSCTIYVPKSWEGKEVTIILNEKVEDEK
jgi:hypothetical protein